MRERASHGALAGIATAWACVWLCAAPAQAGVHPDVLHRIAANDPAVAGAAAAARQAQAAHRSTLPGWLFDTHRNPSVLADGFLTAAVGRHVPGKAAHGARVATADSVCRLLLVRVGFGANRAPGLTSMHPSGDFDVEPDSTIIIDPPPHDVAYFEAHLVALSDYYRVMSNGAFRVEATVFPPAGEPSIKLSDVADYGPGSSGVWTIALLEAYFRDAVAGLDAAADTFDLADFDSYIIVHPGGDLQSDVRGNSPNDIPTFFITLADSIAVEGGAHEIRNGLVMPETTSQDGFIGSIQGALVHEFGHQLGLPDWYNVFSGLPVVGEWSLMDSGNAAFFAATTDPNDPDAAFFAFGLLPTGLTAYERYLLGWETPVLVQAPAQDVSLRPWWSTADANPSSAILPVSPEEYFLVENRRDLLAQRIDLGDSASCPYLNRDLETGVVLWMSKSKLVPSRLRRNSGEYDFWIPSPSAPLEFTEQTPCNAVFFGLLVWHVDERPLIEGLPFNTVNVDAAYPALRLVEASGDYEIGDLLNPNAGFRGDGWNDPFRQNPFVAYTRLDATSVPNNWNSDWAFTGWEITNVQDDGAESQRLSVRVDQGVSGWPALLRDAGGTLLDVDPRSALVADVGGIGRALVAADSHAVFAVHAGAVQELVSGVFKPASLAYAPTFSGGSAVIAALDPDGVWVWDAQWNAGILSEHPGFPAAVPDGAGDRIVLLQDGVLAETGLGAWAEFDASGNVVATYAGVADGREADPVVGTFDAAVGPEAAFVAGREIVFQRLGGGIDSLIGLDFDAIPADVFTAGGAVDPGAAGAQLVLLHRDGRLRVIDRQRGILSLWADLPRDDYIGLALADVDGDGHPDIVASAKQRIIGVNGRGARLFNTPLEVRDLFALRSQGQLLSPAVVADVGGDALPEYVFATDLGLLYALDVDGQPLPGYPRKTLIDLLPSAVLLADLDADAATREIVALSTLSAGVLAPGGDASIPGWTEISGTAARTRFSPSTSPQPESGRLLALERPFFAYPNPTSEPVVRLRITARSQGPYDIRIYNLEGEQVFQHNGMATQGTQEIVWATGELASGTYLCRFVSAAAGVTSPLIEPVTLVR